MRLIENVFKPNHWNGISDVLKRMAFAHEFSPGFKWKKVSGSGRRKKTVLIYFIGGVTLAEVAAIRFLAREQKKEIFIATTNIINGNKLMRSVIHS